ncbi:MAG: DUF86 domain-containing protein [Myxococcota bacterium]
MSAREVETRLKHMLDAARRAVDHSRGRSRQTLDEDELLSLALVRLVEIIGEAAKNVPDEFRRKHPKIPWRAIAGTRDKLIHGYFDVDLDVLWQIVSGDLPELVRELEKIAP